MGEKDLQKEANEQTNEAISNENKQAKEKDIELEDAQNDEVVDEASIEEKPNALEEKMKQLREENEQLNDRLLRLQAEYDNFRKRTEKERIAERKYKVQDLAVDLLPVIDNFERALQTEVTDENKAFREGVQMVYDQFIEALKSHGIEAMEVVNEPFDPNYHHAVMQEENDAIEPNTVTEELQKGFLLKDKVIRPAMVKVNK